MVDTWVWVATVALIAGLLAYDYFFHVRVPHTPTLKEATFWSAIFIAVAVIFGAVVWIFGGAEMGKEYFAGYLTEKALSVDNLFVFLLIMSGFKVPREDQQKVLLFGIVFSLITRTGFIFVGAAMLNAWAWMFYIFGGLLIILAVKQLAPEDEDESLDSNIVVRISRKFFHTTDYYDGDKMFTIVNGKKALTPMLLVMVAIGGTDLLFALDSIPAIFGLTQNTYIVFTATAFSLMGLRQLFFLIDGLLDRLIYLKYGLSAILGFIGVKLILHALHENNVPFINGGEKIQVVEISTDFSLSVIMGVLLITVIASLASPRGKALTAIRNVGREADHYLDLDSSASAQTREDFFNNLLTAEGVVLNLPAQQQPLVAEEHRLLDKLDRAHAHFAEFVAANTQAFPEGHPFAHAPKLNTDAYRRLTD